MSLTSIRYLKREEIDTNRWDACIENASNGLLYASSKYLDCFTSNQWDALVFEDYRFVMPLPFRKKYGVSYLLQPPFTPVLGIFGNEISRQVVHSFLNTIPDKYKLWDISLNHGNELDHTKFKTIPRANYILALTAYEEIRKNYHVNIVRNVTKAHKLKCKVSTDTSIDAVIKICKQTFPNFTKVEKDVFVKVKLLYNEFAHRSVIYGVYHPNGKLLSSAVFIFFKDRAYYWLVGNEKESRQYGASSLLIDSFIGDHASKKYVLDFEGSDAPSVAKFYQKFGGQLEPYITIYNNRLPFPANRLKPLPGIYKSLDLSRSK